MRTISVNTPLQKYMYTCTEPVGKNFHKDFRPSLTPPEMLALGIFGGNYFEGYISEFPKSWWKNAKVSLDGSYHKELNYFGVTASQSREVWQKKGWVHKDDPRGWFEWYCRYYLGRRHADDARQIKRWRAISRHIAQIAHNCMCGDETCRRRQRQAVLHWAYDSRKL